MNDKELIEMPKGLLAALKTAVPQAIFNNIPAGNVTELIVALMNSEIKLETSDK